MPQNWWLRSLMGRLLLLSAVWIATAAAFTLQLALGREIEWQVAVALAILDWGPWIVLSPLVLWFARRVRIDGRNWRKTVPIHLGVALLVVIVLEFSANLAMTRGWIPLPMGGPFREGREHRIVEGNVNDREQTPARVVRVQPRFIRARLTVPIYLLLVAAAHAVAFHQHSLERERRALSAEARLVEARLMALQTQMQPHFLFNTLNTISSLIYEQPKEADEMLCALSELLRSVLAASGRREITLLEELGFIDRYLSIQRIRFADRLEIKREIAFGLEHAAVPTLILQPLIENAVIHGITPQSRSGSVTLKIVEEAGRLIMSVSDTGQGGSTLREHADGTLAAQENVGLGNTRARLAALYGDDAHLVLSRAAEGGVLARIDIPLRRLTA